MFQFYLDGLVACRAWDRVPEQDFGANVAVAVWTLVCWKDLHSC